MRGLVGGAFSHNQIMIEDADSPEITPLVIFYQLCLYYTYLP